MQFVDAVRAELDRRGMPIATLARRSQVSRQTLYTLLAGEPVGEAIRERVARVLDLDSKPAEVA